MSAVVTGVVKLTFGLLSKKVLAYSARKLQNGGLADKEFRNLIIGELDDIKYKLDAYALRELKNGFSSLKQGVECLNMAFSDSVDGTGKSQLPNAIQKQSEDSLLTGIDSVLAHDHAVGKLQGIAIKRYESAERCFETSARDAGKAFHNDALDIEDRILACKVRMASGILKHLADPDLAARICRGYLEELHAKKEIFDIFKVYDNGGFRSFIKKDSRAKAVESVIAINLFLLNFITTFANKEKALNTFEWPLIKHDTDTKVYHPIYFEFTINEPTGRVLPPWCIRALLHYEGISAVNSKGDIILCRRYKSTCFLAKLERETCKLQQLDIPALDKIGEDEDIERNYLAVDEDDTVYLLTRYGQENHYDLFVCDSNANVIHHYPVKVLKGKECRCFGITKDKRLVFCCEFEQNNHLYICDRNGQLEKDFPVHIPDSQVVKDILSSTINEIILVAVRKEDKSSSTIFLHIYSVAGHSLQNIKLRLPAGSKFPSSCTVRYDYLKNNFICLASTTTFRVWKYLQFTETGELRSSCDLNMYIKQLGFNTPNLSSHPKGNVALICQNGALFMQ